MRTRFSLLILLFTCLLNSSGLAATFYTNFVFDDYLDSFDTTQLSKPPLTPGLIQVFVGATPETTQNPAQIVDTLTTTDTAGARRTTTLTIDPVIHLGDLTSFVSTNPVTGNPPNISIGADPATAGTLDVDYDFTVTPLGFIDAGTGNDHVVISLLDGEANSSTAWLEFRDLDGTVLQKDMESELGLDLHTLNTAHVPFTAFPDVNFDELVGMRLTWEAGVAYDGALALIGTGTFNAPPPPVAVPEPTFTLVAVLLCAGLLARRKPLA